MRESNIGKVAAVDNVREIKDNILYYYEQWCKGEIEYSPIREVVERYDRKKLTQRLSEVFDRIVRP